MGLKVGCFAIFLAVFGSFCGAVPMQDGVRVMGALGQSVSIPNHLAIHRNDGKLFIIDAQYRNRSFEDYPYWVARVEWWNQGSAWEFEGIHHKIYLANPPKGILDFSISDGYNMFLINRSIYNESIDLITRIGAGLTFSHPDVTFSDRPRYYVHGWAGHRISGLAVQMGIEKRFSVTNTHYLSAEAKITAAYSRTAISDDYHHDYAVAPDVAFHFIIGIGSNPIQEASVSSILGMVAPLALPISTYVFPNR